MKNIYILILFVLQVSTYSKVGVGLGGYVPFGFSTQKDEEGGRRSFSFDPYLSVNTIVQAPFNHIFLPEFGYVFHSHTKHDDYSKSTMFLLADLGYKVYPSLILRYGLGLFKTSISSDGGAVTLQNGTGTSTFYRPSESKSSYNTTWNLGLENSWNQFYATRFQFYMFEPISSKRDVSYSLSLNYYF